MNESEKVKIELTRLQVFELLYFLDTSQETPTKKEIRYILWNSIPRYACDEDDDEDMENGPLGKPISEYIKDIAGVSDDLKG